MSRPITRELSEWIAGLRFEDVPPEVVERTKLIVADITAIDLRGRNDSESTPPLVAAIEALDLASGRFHVIGDARTYSATGATLNACAAPVLAAGVSEVRALTAARARLRSDAALRR